MVSFLLNNEKVNYEGDLKKSLLSFLRNDKHITSVKDGCSGQAYCGACMVEINGEIKLSCVTKMEKLDSAEIITPEGIPDHIRDIIAKAFVEKGAVQCGFCTPGFIMRTKVLFQKNPMPSREEIAGALNMNLCRCTGYIKIIDAIEMAVRHLRENKAVTFSETKAGIGSSYPKYQAYETAIGARKFVNDMHFEGMLFGALRFSEHPRARIKRIDVSDAEKLQGVIKVVTAKDVPGTRFTGLIYKDWPLMIAEGEITKYIGDVLCGVIACDESTARNALKLITVDYEILPAVTDTYQALQEDAEQVHPGRSNLLENCIVRRGGNIEEAIKNSAYVSSGFYQTQRIEHAFLETESAIALPEDGGIHLYSQGQGIYVDRRQVSELLNIPEDKLRITMVPCGGGFGGKEDLTVQGHAALYAQLTGTPVKVTLSREESIRMHPKRHPVFMDITLACDEKGMLTALRLRAVGDTGAYASVGTKVMERVAGHASAGYHVPVVDIESKTVYTNNIPCGAMRGFGANQAAFSLESCIDDLCEKGGFDRWKFRYDNALTEGKMTATGQVLEKGVGIRATLLAVQDEFYKNKFTGLACSIKNCGVGNGMIDFSHALIEIRSEKEIVVKHGWTDMGQGISNVVIQILATETGIDPHNVVVEMDTEAGLETGMTTSSRATVLLGNALIDASRKLKSALDNKHISELSGQKFSGYSECNWTTRPGADVEKIVTHFSYGYATQLVILDEEGKLKKVVAAHDAGKVMNKTMFEGQIEGAVVMGLGYALSENLLMENGYLKSDKLKDCRLLKAKDVPEIVVKAVEVSDNFGPYGAKGVGEIGLVPTAAAVANAYYCFDKIKRFSLPLKLE
ncbi:MAG: selenium-dependent xanthine dehydrogenase [Bacteroidales bacterium]|jgi:selenium-dependent xanthine dehydrogenase|nr:selenium-dependent xanthine dehydrogenase [Bacteroidales bacterium]MDD4214361.1 selenium-dependent xanthine dehydrogenase [Bacteroidales bacterium]